jgi:uncharacterized protein
MSRVLHPVLTPDQRRRLVRQGVDCFNRGEFYDAHEVWEDVWRSNLPEPRTLLQGLIQVAAGMHQFLDLHRTIGPRRTLAKAAAHLEPYAPVTLGLDVAGLLAGVSRWRAWLEVGGAQPPVPELPVVDPQSLL